MMVTTTENIPGRKVKEVLGIVFGCCVQMKHIGKDLRELVEQLLAVKVSHIQNLWRKQDELLCKE